MLYLKDVLPRILFRYIIQYEASAGIYEDLGLKLLLRSLDCFLNYILLELEIFKLFE